MPRRLVLAVTVAAVAALPAPAAATPPRPPMLLPGDAGAASVRADRATWIVGARPGRAADAVAGRHGARRAGTGAYVVARGRARELAAALRAHAACCSTPSPTGSPRSPRPRRPTRSTPAPPGAPRSSTRSLVPPPVTPQSPLLALVDSTADVSHPEFAGASLSTLGGFPLESAHGTETAAIAAAPKNDAGILGVWPGMRAVNVVAPERDPLRELRHGDRARDRAGRRGDQHELRLARALLRGVRAAADRHREGDHARRRRR